MIIYEPDTLIPYSEDDMPKVNIPPNPHHRCFSQGKVGEDEALRERIIIERKDLTFPTLVNADVYGALELFFDDEGNLEFFFVLIREDDQIMCPEFVLGDDFKKHVNNEMEHAVHCTPMRQAFGVSGHIDKVIESHLEGIWLARCLAAKFKFAADISFNGRTSMTTEGVASVTMTRPWSGQEKTFMATLSPDEADQYIGPGSPEGGLYFGVAA